MSDSVFAEVIAVGDELVNGQRVDTNSSWISCRLGELGVQVRWHTTVGDRLEDLTGAIAQAVRRAQVVVLTGGLGPTEDDLTREALAQAAGRPLEFHPVLWKQIQELFRRRGRPVPEQNRRQAFLPQGAQALNNPHGTAPGVAMSWEQEGHGAWIFALPGVPAEVHEMWPQVQKLLTVHQVVRGTWVCRTIKLFGLGESDVQARVPGLFQQRDNPQVSITVSEATISVHLRAHGPDESSCHQTIKPLWERVHQQLGPWIFGYDQEELQDVVVRELVRQGRTLTSLECSSGGLLAKWLSEVPGSPDVYRAGVVWPRSRFPAPLAAEQLHHLGQQLCAQEHADLALVVGPVIPAGSECGPEKVLLHLCTLEGCQNRELRWSGHPQVRAPRTAKNALDLLRRWLLEHAVNPSSHA